MPKYPKGYKDVEFFAHNIKPGKIRQSHSCEIFFWIKHSSFITLRQSPFLTLT